MKQTETITTISAEAQAVIDQYLNLNLGGKTMPAVYHINSGHIKDLRVMVGKGTSTEIEMETKIWAQLKGLDLMQMDQDHIRQFMRQRSIGVDCSGYLFHIFDSWLKASRQRGLAHQLKFVRPSLWFKLKLRLRPAENIGADMMTSDLNSAAADYAEVQPGYVIRSNSILQNVDHIMLITKVARNQDGELLWFEYTHSTYHFGTANGVRIGKIAITNAKKALAEQDWQERDANGRCFTLEGFKTSKDNGIRRPNFYSLLKQ